MHSDPIADMLTRIRNACRVLKKRVDIPRSNLKLDIARVLKSEGYIDDYREISNKLGGQGIIEVKLRYDGDISVIQNIQRMSRPGLRKYMKHEKIPKVRNGLGIIIMSTSKGLMTDRRARKASLGGESLCQIW